MSSQQLGLNFQDHQLQQLRNYALHQEVSLLNTVLRSLHHNLWDFGCQGYICSWRLRCFSIRMLPSACLFVLGDVSSQSQSGQLYLSNKILRLSDLKIVTEFRVKNKRNMVTSEPFRIFRCGGGGITLRTFVINRLVPLKGVCIDLVLSLPETIK